MRSYMYYIGSYFLQFWSYKYNLISSRIVYTASYLRWYEIIIIFVVHFPIVFHTSNMRVAGGLLVHIYLQIISRRVYLFWPNLSRWYIIYKYMVYGLAHRRLCGNKAHTISDRRRDPIAAKGVSDEWNNKKQPCPIINNGQQSSGFRVSSFFYFYFFLSK